jgi:putative spermidine/putrescine transport system ATP-binding protein
MDMLMNDAPLPSGEKTFAVQPTAKLRAAALSKRYGTVEALHPTDLEVSAGEFLTVLGPSGSGKTTLLQIICGLVEPSSGRLFIDGRDETTTPAHRRGIGVVFQNYALFPHLTVAENVAFPLQMRRLPAAILRRKVTDTLAMVGLDGLRDRFPRELSGGQQQRVALARCFVYEPALIMMDEPLGALDRKLREAMQIELKRLHRDTGATIIFVTHDQEEALAMSDRICLMNAGRIEQIGTPQEIYEHPASLFAADFIGISNVLGGTVDAAGRLATEDGSFALPDGAGAQSGNAGALVIRPEHVEIDAPGAQLRGTVIETVYAGSELRVILHLASGNSITARRGAGLVPPAIGATVSVGWQRGRARFLPSP